VPRELYPTHHTGNRIPFCLSRSYRKNRYPFPLDDLHVSLSPLLLFLSRSLALVLSIMAALPRRILKETERLMADPPPGISGAPSDDNLRYFTVYINGPESSPYEGMHILVLISDLCRRCI